MSCPGSHAAAGVMWQNEKSVQGMYTAHLGSLTGLSRPDAGHNSCSVLTVRCHLNHKFFSLHDQYRLWSHEHLLAVTHR